MSINVCECSQCGCIASCNTYLITLQQQEQQQQMPKHTESRMQYAKTMYNTDRSRIRKSMYSDAVCAAEHGADETKGAVLLP
jgi:hypothetical protein